ncbi:SGNH/GDSL hydrolase family protein [Mycolicibacterium fluoranthenivorans]|jgi:lysophospholipase L1-like esterase|uniref:Lysophospholipase L1 n=1 Tax=Mycolicibacterium fluoranthenivorans TaxID=258505 RepID=A0A1G4WAN3_9MYCO|nr:SGNH/GDSL hydrolase family protein [Mycolicibacterium fluoranthenivorans]SCX19503.1 Lysophospholipase L1 [Mycolicibacterium fluoranthenivorans]
MTTRLMCLGDSNTTGDYGVSYVGMLAQRLAGADVTVTGSGVNGEVSYGLVQRLDPVIDQQPTAITVLIGTNDAWGTLSDANARQVVKRCELPYAPSAPRFREHLASIVARLQSATDARIAVLSPPVLGQQLDSAAAHTGREFAEIVADTAREYGVTYLPLFERQCEQLRNSDADPVPLRTGEREWYSAVLQHVLLRRSYDRISERRGLLLTTDHVHQNSRGAGMIADLIEQFVKDGVTDH